MTGGCGDPGCAITLASAELYNPVSGAWTTTGSLHDPRARHRTALLPNGQVLVAGGCIPANCSTVLDSAELYHPRTGAWTTTGSLQTARCCVGLMLLHTGQALAIGGHDQTGASTSAELYNPVRGAWTATGSLSDAREYEVPETATLLPSGQVLVAGDGGGNNNGATPLASAELYHPRRGVWTATGALHDPRSFQTTTLLSNGQVLVAGGINATGILATAELYQP